ncbi:MAG: lipase maturation factor family protein [Actinobacteria bacterium]|nr:lipase maturation factor family protein [Actinomycetota bacterium]
MEWFDASGYQLARLLFERTLAGIYLIAFFVTINQWRPLVGARGLTPVTRYLAATGWRDAPTLFRWRYSDRLAEAAAWTGAILSVALLVGLPQQGSVWAPMLAWGALWALYLSFVNVGRIWYAFGWESILLEAGFLAAFLGSEVVAPPLVTILLLRWLLFRVEFGAGLIKLRGDPCWRDLTCLEYHHETQPMPSLFSWWFHHLPRPLHKVEVLANHATQLIVPFGLFAPQPVAGIAGAIILGTQGWLVISGNFSWLNALAMILALTAFPDSWLDPILPADPAASLAATPAWLVAVVLLVAAGTVTLSWWPVRNMASPGQAMNRSFNPFHLVNTYGAFGSITKERYEIVLEGSLEQDPSEDDWREYGFKAKPGDPSRRPPQIAPYHLRLDWLMWFAAMSSPSRHPWFVRLVVALLEADPGTLDLLRHDPFDGQRPATIRARLFRYRFTTPQERRETGDWWVRRFERTYLPPVTPGDLPT